MLHDVPERNDVKRLVLFLLQHFGRIYVEAEMFFGECPCLGAFLDG